MSYVALYRKFRPQTFDQLKGQDHVVRALKNQLIHERIGHAYLFTGTRGTGKTSAAKIFAKAVNCLHPVDGEPCNECENCLAVNAGSFVDVTEVDAASNNGVDDIRRIIEEVRYTPVRGRYKVFIIDEAHMITGSAFNAFLKTLEEPPAYAVFILATTEPHKLPITILSRCQRYDFRRITSEQISDNLAFIAGQEGISADDKALKYIARAGDGSMRDAVSLLDKCIAFNLGEKLTYETVLDTLGTVDTEVFSRLFGSVSSGDAAGALSILDEAAAQGRDLTQFTSDFIWYIRNLLMTRAADVKDPEVLGVSPENMEQIIRDASRVEGSILLRYIRVLSELINKIRYSAEKQVLLETGLIRLARPEMEADVESLADRIRHLEEALKAGQIPAGNIPRASAPAEQAPAYYEEPFPYPEPLAEPEEGFYGEPEIRYEPEPEVRPQKAPAKDTGSADPKDLWKKITAACSNPRIRFALGKCTAAFPEEHRIRISAPNVVVLNQLKDEETLKELRRLVSEAAGKELEVQTVLKRPEADRDTDGSLFPEEVLGNINFTIGTEEW